MEDNTIAPHGVEFPGVEKNGEGRLTTTGLRCVCGKTVVRRRGNRIFFLTPISIIHIIQARPLKNASFVMASEAKQS
ncbi:MAG: hypothetical protein JW943_04405 [Deltaproteobacteria bacterium]|nr:hypothetical protein [Deltaproteobacteria bacterium]